ncbi:MAG: hypothetical protein R3D26_11335 [Cyanobacteriota/Melainabacteria group bacterium]
MAIDGVTIPQGKTMARHGYSNEFCRVEIAPRARTDEPVTGTMTPSVF